MSRKKTRSAAGGQSKGIPKVETGIGHLDVLTMGGLPAGRTTVVRGAPGTAKTVFALQTLVHGVRAQGEPGIFVAFEESVSRIRQNASGMKWWDDALADDKLALIDAPLPTGIEVSGTPDLSGFYEAIRAKAEAMGARRLVLDGIDMLLTVIDEPSARRNELLRLHQWLLDLGLSAIVTAKTGGAIMSSTDDAVLDYLADCVVEMEAERRGSVFVRTLGVTKYRGSDYQATHCPFMVTTDGVRLIYPGRPALSAQTSARPVSTGVRRLDEAMDGGYRQGSTVLVSGVPGTAKTSLAVAFADAACRRGEHAVFVSFDESEEQIRRNAKGIGYDFPAHAKAGRLHMLSLRAATQNPASHFVQIEPLVETYEPTTMVIDPISALLKAKGDEFVEFVTESLLALAKSRGITLLCTSLSGDGEHSASQVSTIADAWLHLTYNMTGGERNRALTIVKARGIKHSSQVGELIIEPDGLRIAETYAAAGEILMGTARLEREMADRVADENRRIEQEERKLDIERSIARDQDRMRELERELEWLKRERELVETKEARWREHSDAAQRMRLSKRDSAEDGGGPGVEPSGPRKKKGGQ